MSRGYILIVLFTFVICASCNNASKKTEDIKTLIDLTENPNPRRKIIVDDFKYIILETTSKTRLSRIDKIMFGKNNIYIFDSRSSVGVFVFNREGKFIKTIGQKGHGPNEFIYVTDFDIDKEENIYLLDVDRKQILKYNSKAEFIENVRYDFFTSSFSYLGDDQFLFFQKGIKSPQKPQLENVLILWNKEHGIVDTFFPFTKKTIPFGRRFSIFKSSNALYYCSYFDDNIVSIDNAGQPHLAYKIKGSANFPHEDNFNKQNAIEIVKDINKLGLCNGLTNCYEANGILTFSITCGEITTAYYDKKTNSILEFGEEQFTENNILGNPLNVIGVDHDYFVSYIDPFVLKHELDVASSRGLSRDEMAMKKVSAHDNPIIVLYKLDVCKK